MQNALDAFKKFKALVEKYGNAPEEITLTSGTPEQDENNANFKRLLAENGYGHIRIVESPDTPEMLAAEAEKTTGYRLGIKLARAGTSDIGMGWAALKLSPVLESGREPLDTN